MGDPKGFMIHTRRAPKYLPVEERLRNHDEHVEILPEETVRTQASRCMDCGVPFCMSGCPLGNLIPEWNDLVYRGRWKEALEVLHATNNFPEFTGRVCPAPCENSCVLGINEPPVTIKLHEVSIVDKGFEMGWIRPEPPPKRSGKRVAIVGSGPAGLACAQQLNRAGHTVTVFEKHDRAGGLLMYGIPHYKLRKEKVQRRIDLLAAEGIAFRLRCHVGVDVSFQELRRAFDAIVICTGAEQPRDLQIPGRELDGIHFAMEYLPQSNRANWGDADIAALHPKRQRIWAEGKRVIVIGGGDTGSDCIGTALRQGAVSVVNFELLPAPPERRAPNNPWPQWARIRRISSSVEEMLARGGDVYYSISTKAFHGQDGRVCGLTTVDLDWSSGKPVEKPGSERRWDCDLVLLALGFLGPRRPGLLEQAGVALDERGNVRTDPQTRMTSVEGVFAAGDARRGQSLVVWAISEGREIARAVDEWLTGEPSLLPAVRLDPFQY
ncbi:MAG: glutamate synthase subunit beta [Planctomycetota bacterium]|nr:glutamate synthase subunit beta [Planctomycetota bacterium]MCX8040728.1 glutamate synthase subunit beta [Planctomycetota bacterium]MDW8372381.1 glutamate synthase subunit beta [Planctomycetota bacterium]